MIDTKLMILLLLLAVELIILYIISRNLTQRVFELCLLVFRARSVAVTIITILNFPGTVVHELSHLFTAEILGVHTGRLTLTPESIQRDEIKAGSVMIAKTDPFRRYAIGLAPVFIGLLSITALSYVLPGLWHTVIQSSVPWYSNINTLLLVLNAYGLLAISNSMFSSPEDLKGFLPFVGALAIMVAAAFFAGIRVGLTGPALTLVTQILDALVKSLGGVLAITVAGLLVTRLLILLVQKLTRRKLLQ